MGTDKIGHRVRRNRKALPVAGALLATLLAVCGGTVSNVRAAAAAGGTLAVGTVRAGTDRSTNGSTSASGGSTASPGGSTSGSTASPSTTPETKADLAVDILTFLKKTPSPPGKSPYTDVKASSPQWGYVKLALQYGLLKPDGQRLLGVDDPVLGATLALAVAHLYGVPITSTFTASQWIEQAGLMPSAVVESNLSHAQVMSFLSALADWSAVQKAFPHSWSLTAAEGEALLRACSNTAESEQYQMNLTQTQSGTFVLTPSGKHNATYTQLAALESKQVDLTKTSIQSSTTGGQTSVLTTTQHTNAGKVTNETEYLSGLTLYAYDGKQWSSASLRSSDLETLKSITGNLTLSGFTGVTAAPQSGGKVVYTMSLQPATMKTVIIGMIQSAGLQPSASLVTLYLKDTAVTVTMTAAPVQNTDRIVNQTVRLEVRIPGVDFNTLSGAKLSASQSAAFASAVKEFDELVTEDSAITYNAADVTAPKGLPSLSGSGGAGGTGHSDGTTDYRRTTTPE